MNQARDNYRNPPLIRVKVEQGSLHIGESQPSDVRLFPHQVTGSGTT